jgi:microcompartment protein CcmK/EutM
MPDASGGCSVGAWVAIAADSIGAGVVEFMIVKLACDAGF